MTSFHEGFRLGRYPANRVCMGLEKRPKGFRNQVSRAVSGRDIELKSVPTAVRQTNVALPFVAHEKAVELWLIYN